MSATSKRDPLGSGWMILAALGFTLMNLCIKAAAQKFGFTSGELVFWRMSFAVVFLGMMAKARGDSFATPHWKTHLNRSIVGSAAMLCLFYAITHLPLATGVTLSYTSSIFLAVFSFFIFKERIAPYTQAVLVVGFIGVVLLLNPSFQSGQELAALLGLAGGAMSGWAYLKVRELSLLGEPGWRVVFYLSLVGMVMAAVWASITGWHALSYAALPYLLAVGLSAMVAQLCMTRAYKVGNKFTVASLSYLTVVFSALAGMVLLGDEITWQEVFGMGIIVASGVLSGIEPARVKKLFVK
ncbi:DMT family transporter [Neisseria animalis]|uniref:DMT family transporter n=1 Tax=Neisseria animalis TaxID=492 RepID=A0A5P3MTX4_NEIAN|nr:DMT family transporter [Neisseria animalis]QEY24515.1 DMT family transporter [Neisseria animalis]ROW33067.1 DMT family transporter [Neisseria animalis]VEE07240.1 Predicted permease, DMT superfamily [Neisseria animalis]